MAKRFEFWTEGVDALTESADRARGAYEYPYMTFFGYTRRLLPEFNKFDHRARDRIESAYRYWRKVASAQGHMVVPELRAAADDFPDAWRTVS